MLDNDVKQILLEQFSKEQNYKMVLRRVNKKQITFGKVLKIASLPTCAAIIAAIIIHGMNNNPNENNHVIAQANLVTNNIEIDVDNKVTEKVDESELIENVTTEVENEIINDIEKEVVPENKDNTDEIKVAKDTTYKTIEGGESSWAYDPSIPENILNDHPESKYVVKVKILSVGEGEMLPRQENFYNPFTCHTPIKMQVIDNFKDTNSLSGTLTAYITGGKIKIANILKGTKQEIEYMGIYDASQVDPEQYIEYKWSVPYYEFNIGEEYVLILNKTNSSLYQIFDGGYGIFTVEKLSDGSETYKNVISGKILEM